MRSCKEMRQDAWNILTGSNWIWKILLNGFVLYAIMMVAIFALVGVYEYADIQTWDSFREAQLAAKRSGIELAVPSAREMFRMTVASGFSMFIQYLFQGIVVFGLVTTLVKCIKGESEGWFTGAFGGFKQPFGLLWLTALMMIKVMLWALIFAFAGGFVGGITSAGLRVAGMLTEKQLGAIVGCMCAIPAFVAAIVASFRYALAWYVKAENTELGANACLTRSCELMRGRKWKLFIFWLSYIGWSILALLPLCIGAVIQSLKTARGGIAAAMASDGDSVSVALLVAFGITLIMMLFVGIYAALGQAVFYRDAKAESGTEPQAVKA